MEDGISLTDIDRKMMNSVLATRRMWHLWESLSRQLDIRVWNSGLRRGLEMEIQTPLMYKEQERWLALDAGMGAGKMGEAQGGGAPTQNVRRWGCKMSIVSQKGKEESFKKEKCMESSKLEECFDCICFQFHLFLLDLWGGPTLHSKCSKSSFQGNFHCVLKKLY